MRWVVTIAVLALGMIGTAVSAGAIDPSKARNAVVKVQSNILGNTNVFKGSGLLFRREGKTYVLTSDHVLFHAGGFVGEHYALRSQPELMTKLRYLVAEWGNGLALLEVKGEEVPEAVPELAELKAKAPLVKGVSIDLLGFPWESKVLTLDRGAVRDPSSAQSFFVQLSALVEIEDTLGEFGMSGGPAFTKDGDFVGVLSHQRLQAGEKNLVYVIPAASAVAWIESYFAAGEAFRTVFHESIYFQGKSENIVGVINDEVTFSFERKTEWEVTISYLEGEVPFFEVPTRLHEDKGGWMKRFSEYARKHPNRTHPVRLFTKAEPAKAVPYPTPTAFFRLLDDPAIVARIGP